MYFLIQSFKDKNVLKNFFYFVAEHLSRHETAFQNLKLGKVEFYVLHHPVNILEALTLKGLTLYLPLRCLPARHEWDQPKCL